MRENKRSRRAIVNVVFGLIGLHFDTLLLMFSRVFVNLRWSPLSVVYLEVQERILEGTLVAIRIPLER